MNDRIIARWRFAVSAGAALLLTVSSGVAANASSPLGVTPFLTSVHENSVTSWTATFGYLNLNSSDVQVSIGQDNFVLQGDPFRNQPYDFKPGLVADAFTATFDPSEGIIWDLNGSFAGIESSSELAGYLTDVTLHVSKSTVQPGESIQLSGTVSNSFSHQGVGNVPVFLTSTAGLWVHRR